MTVTHLNTEKEQLAATSVWLQLLQRIMSEQRVDTAHYQ